MRPGTGDPVAEGEVVATTLDPRHPLIRKRPGSHTFRLGRMVMDALDLKAMHKAEHKVSERRDDRDHHRTRASATLVD